MLPTLQAFRQAGGGLQSGSFAFSYGIDGAIAMRGGLTAGKSQLFSTALRHRRATYHGIALLRSFRAAGVLAAIVQVDRDVKASMLVESFAAGGKAEMRMHAIVARA